MSTSFLCFSCRDLAGRITNEFNIARDRIVGMIEGSQEMLDLTSSESLPASLTKKEPPVCFIGLLVDFNGNRFVVWYLEYSVCCR